MISRRGICYDLKKSKYRFKSERLTFVFSSELHLTKFIERMEDHRNSINLSLSNRFNYDIVLNELSDIVLYKKIENRGFLIVTHKGEELCQKNLKYVGGRTMLKS